MVGLIIMDGFGIAPAGKANAITTQGTPNLDKLFQKYPHTQLGASGLDVGLPDGQMGNSEVGHLNLGAGRVVYQDLTHISKEIADGGFFKNEVLLNAMHSARDNGKKFHVMGLLGPGGVHSHIEHLFALIKMAKEEKLEQIYVHCFLDGRDLPPSSAAHYAAELNAYMKEIGFGKIASVCGRYYAMDRDNRWDRVEKAYDMLTLGKGVKETDAVAAIEHSYADGVTDEFVLPAVITENGRPLAIIEKGDSVVFFNFRPDRARELTRALTVEDFSAFERKTGYLAPKYVCFTRYDDTFKSVEIAFKPRVLVNTLGEYLAKNKRTQLRIAETEKYAHVTFFFNGGVEAPNAGEDRILVPSPKVATYDLQPEMSAAEVAEKAVSAILSKKYDVMILNFANCDMVGHTGVFAAAMKAVETVDICVKKVVDAILAVGGVALITADHGNADHMIDENGEPFTAHTTNPVPLLLVGEKNGRRLSDGGKLCDISPTMLELLSMPIPQEMTGRSLLVK
jgi:2,3-bisphosphoglycerate-independent phosphoglycerate mutase